MSSNFGGKRDENRRTLTDFKIIGLTIPDLSWTWGVIPSLSDPSKDEIKLEPSDSKSIGEGLEKNEDSKDAELADVIGTRAETKVDASSEVDMADASSQPADLSPPPPSRIRIYFHTPATADDLRPIPHNPSYGEVPTDSRKGKRKKIEDDDVDLELFGLI